MTQVDGIANIGASRGLVDVEIVGAAGCEPSELSPVKLDSFYGERICRGDQQVHLVVTCDVNFDFAVRYDRTVRV